MSESTSALAPQNKLMMHETTGTNQNRSENLIGSSGEDDFLPFGEDGLTFFDLIDIVNPLQHIPIISTIYQNLTGDTIDPAAKLAGGALFGGPIGAAASLAGIILEEATGKDIGDHVLALFSDDENNSPQIKIAENIAPSNNSSQNLNYAEVFEWAQNEASAGMISFSTQNAELQTQANEHIKVSQWARNVTQNKQPFNEPPGITGAEFALLQAESTTVEANVQAAQLPPNPSAPSMNDVQKAVSYEDQIIISENKLNQGWRQNNTDFNVSVLAAYDHYAQNTKIASIDQSFVFDKKY